MGEEIHLVEIEINLKRWDLDAKILRTVHAILGISAVLFSLLVAAKINSFDTVLIEWFAFLAALSVGIQTGFDLGNKANKFRRAWRLLNWSHMKYKSGDHTIEKLIDDYKAGEEIVGDVKEIVR